MRVIFFYFLIFFVAKIYAQDIDYARFIVDTLCSREMAGRGYSENGDKKCAEFIKNELSINKIESLDYNYFQKFNIKVNTFPKDVFVSINNVPLIPEEDFYISPYSGTVEGSFEVFWIDSIIINSNRRLKKSIKKINGKVCAIDFNGVSKTRKKEIKELFSNVPLGAKSILFIDSEDIMFGVASFVLPYAIINIRSESISERFYKIDLKIENEYYHNYETQNVIATIDGTHSIDSFIVFCAHYDHLGLMGKDVYIPGANDNATGVSILLDFAKYFNKNKLKYSIVFVFTSAEEIGLVGSQYFVNNPLIDLSKIKFLINMDLIGSGENGIAVVNGENFSAEFNLLDSLNKENKYMVNIKKRGPAKNSDHYPFYEKGVPSFFVYTMGESKSYHDTTDTPENLSFFAYKNLFCLIRDFVNKL